MGIGIDKKSGGYRGMLLLIIAAGLFAYHNSFSVPFIYDDWNTVVENLFIRRLWPLVTPLSAAPGDALAGRPVVSLTLAINYAGGGLTVWGYHAVNLALHIVAGLALFGIIRRTLQTESLRTRYRGQATRLAGAITLIWMVHPLLTESVTYISQRTELLMGMFLLLTLYAAIRAFESGLPIWYLASIGACALGMGSKEIMVVAPVVVLAYDRTAHPGSWRDWWLRRQRFYMGLFATWLILPVLLRHADFSSKTGFRDASVTLWRIWPKPSDCSRIWLRATTIWVWCWSSGAKSMKELRTIKRRSVSIRITPWRITTWASS